MPSENEKANLQQMLERTRAAIGVFGSFERELRSIRKSITASVIRARVEEMARLNRDTLAALERRLALLEREISLRTGMHADDRPHPVG